MQDVWSLLLMVIRHSFCSLHESNPFFIWALQSESSPNFFALLYQSLCIISSCNAGPAESTRLTDGSRSCCLQSFPPHPQPIRLLHTHIWHHFQLHSVWLCVESCPRLQHYITPTWSRCGNMNWVSSEVPVWMEAVSVIPAASPLWGTLWGKDHALGAVLGIGEAPP